MLSKKEALTKALRTYNRKVNRRSKDYQAGLPNGRIEGREAIGMRDARRYNDLEVCRYELKYLFGFPIGYTASTDPLNPPCPEYDKYREDLDGSAGKDKS